MTLPTLGARVDGDGVAFAVFSGVAESVDLCLFDDAGAETRDLARGRRGVRLARPGRRRGPGHPLRLSRARPVGSRLGQPLQPGQAAARSLRPSDRRRRAVASGGAGRGPRRLGAVRAALGGGRVGVRLGRRPPRRGRRSRTRSSTSCTSRATRGFTRRSPSACGAPTAGWPQPAVIEHLQRLGVTAVELLPVHQFVHDGPLVARGLRNYWGYQSIGYFAPHNEYSSAGDGGEQVDDFKAMVRGAARRRAGGDPRRRLQPHRRGRRDRADAVLPRSGQRGLLPAGRRPLAVRGRHRHRQHVRHPPAAGAAPGHGLAALLGAGDARRRLPLRPRRQPRPRRRPTSIPTARSWRRSARTPCSAPSS